MYKRRAKVLFLDVGAGSRARMAQAWAQGLGGRWVEAGAAALADGDWEPALAEVMAEVGVTAEMASCPSWARAREQEWDLVVILDAEGRGNWPQRLEGLRVKPWELAGACPAGDSGASMADLRSCRDALRDRVDGLLGGFRMKAREDDKEATMTNDGSPRKGD